METYQADYTIIGSGITGLTMAFYLQRAGKKVLVVDKETHTGGVIGTLQKDGFTFETGPNTGVIGSPELVELFDHLRGKAEAEQANADAKFRWIWKNGKWEPLPSGLISAIRTPLFSLKDKFRILGEPFRKPGKNPDETVADLVVRRLGTSYLNYAVNPFISGVYAGNPHQLVTRYALPKLYNLEQKYGSFIRGSMKKSKEPKTELEKRVTREVFSAKGGLGRLTDALASEIGEDNLLLGISGLVINPSNDGFACEGRLPSGNAVEIQSGNVVTTVDGMSLSALLPFVDTQRLAALSNARYAKVIQAVACYKKWDGISLKAFGGLVPTSENRQVLGILFPSSIFPDRAPEGGAILSVFMGGINKPELFDKTDAEIKQLVLSEIKETMGTSGQPDMLHIFRYARAIPQYEITTGERLEAIDSIQKEFPGLTLAGNIRDGIGMSDRVKQGRQVADTLITIGR